MVWKGKYYISGLFSMRRLEFAILPTGGRKGISWTYFSMALYGEVRNLRASEHGIAKIHQLTTILLGTEIHASEFVFSLQASRSFFL